MAKSLRAVGENHLDVALNEVNSLLKINPNFKLAQLVRGDLLLARAKPISNFGDAPNAPQGLVQDLREEANVRLQRAQQQQPLGVPKLPVATFAHSNIMPWWWTPANPRCTCTRM